MVVLLGRPAAAGGGVGGGGDGGDGGGGGGGGAAAGGASGAQDGMRLVFRNLFDEAHDGVDRARVVTTGVRPVGGLLFLQLADIWVCKVKSALGLSSSRS